MKIKYILLIILMLSFIVSAQVSTKLSQGPDLLIVSQEWNLYTQNPALDDDPFRANDEVRQAQEDIKINIQQNKIRVRGGLPTEPPPVRTSRSKPPLNETRSIYKYEVKIKNTGNKTIEALICDYVFFERSTKKEIGRIQFISTEEIPPGKIKKLVLWTAAPPSKVISATQSSSQLREQYSEQIIIQSIQYTDNTAWNLPDK